MKNEISDQNLTINELKRELQLFKDFMRAMRVSNPAMRAIADQMERDEVVRWSSSLARARVTRWGGMISTPDDSLQVVVYFQTNLRKNVFVKFSLLCVHFFFLAHI